MEQGWSAPTAIATFGVSWGALIGLDVTDYVIILNNAEAVQAFSGSGQVSIGAGIEVAVGPVGRWGFRNEITYIYFKFSFALP